MKNNLIKTKKSSIELIFQKLIHKADKNKKKFNRINISFILS